MTIAFIFWGKYDGFNSALACANARANCPVIVIADRPHPMGKLLAETVGNWCSYSLSRWFVLLELGRKMPHIFPVFCCDWDVMIFQDLAKAYEPFQDCDFTVSMDGNMMSAVYGMNRVEPLEALCEVIKRDAKDKTLNDMEATARLAREGNWKVGNLFEIKNDSVFDHNIVCGSERFQMDGNVKRIVWHNQSPYFVRHDGGLVRANTIHCWGPFKSKPAELLKKAI